MQALTLHPGPCRGDHSPRFEGSDRSPTFHARTSSVLVPCTRSSPSLRDEVAQSGRAPAPRRCCSSAFPTSSSRARRSRRVRTPSTAALDGSRPNRRVHAVIAESRAHRRKGALERAGGARLSEVGAERREIIDRGRPSIPASYEDRRTRASAIASQALLQEHEGHASIRRRLDTGNRAFLADRGRTSPKSSCAFDSHRDQMLGAHRWIAARPDRKAQARLPHFRRCSREANTHRLEDLKTGTSP